MWLKYAIANNLKLIPGANDVRQPSTFFRLRQENQLYPWTVRLKPSFSPASIFPKSWVAPSRYFCFMEVKIEPGWKALLTAEFEKPYFSGIVAHLKTEKSQGKIIYPPGPLIFNAFDQTAFSQLKVVIIGQDPYHGQGQAMGLSFSVPKGIKPPPSLLNIYKELQQDIGMPMPTHGDLTNWAKEGVLLLNAALTVRANEPNSHAQIGWHQFTDAVIQKISQERKGIVFLLWGKFAQAKQVLIDSSKHYMLGAAHPSPYSASNGFFGCKHFSKTNEILAQQGLEPVNWKLD